MGVSVVKEHTVPVLIVATLPADKGVCLFPLCRCHVVKGTVLLALYGRRSFIWIIFHVFPPFAFCCRSLRKDFLLHSCGVFLLWYTNALLLRERYSFLDGHSVFKVQLIDELP